MKNGLVEEESANQWITTDGVRAAQNELRGATNADRFQRGN